MILASDDIRRLTMTRPTHVTLYPDNLRHNYALAKAHATGPVWAVVKADAYGHGARFCATELAPVADGFAVACVDEARALRHFGIEQPILVMQGAYRSSEWRDAESLNLTMMVHHLDQLDFIPSQLGQIDVWLKVNSGMNRLGVNFEEVDQVLALVDRHPSLNLTQVASHFATADRQQDPLFRRQQACMASRQWPVQLSFCNSAALFNAAEIADGVSRPGIMLYGASPLADKRASDLGLKPVMSLQSAIISTHDVAVGDSIGYGQAWVAERPTKVGVVAIGYGDGYPRCAPNGTPVAVDGVICPLIGRVSMDMITVDLTDYPEAHIGSQIECWGLHVDVDQVAALCHTIAYELFCQITPRVARQLESCVAHLDNNKDNE